MKSAHEKNLAKIRTFSGNIINRGGYVYFILGKDGLTKVGLSIDPERRLGQLKYESDIPLTIWAIIPYEDGFDLEKYFHKIFSSRRVEGEWFNLGRDDFNLAKEFKSIEYLFEGDPQEFFDPNCKRPRIEKVSEYTSISKKAEIYTKEIWRRQNGKNKLLKRNSFSQMEFKRAGFSEREISVIYKILRETGCITGFVHRKLCMPPDEAIEKITPFLVQLGQFLEYSKP